MKINEILSCVSELYFSSTFLPTTHPAFSLFNEDLIDDPDILILNEKSFDDFKEVSDKYTFTEINGIEVAIPNKRIRGGDDTAIIINQQDLDVKFLCDFNSVNKEINQFAAKSPRNMFFVLGLPILSQGTAWTHVRNFYHIIMGAIEQSNGSIERLEVLKNENGDSIEAAKMFRYGQLKYVGELYRNKDKIYNMVYNKGYIDDDFKLFQYLGSIPGLGTVKAAFSAQLLNGSFGCLDNINQDVYGIPIKIASLNKNKDKVSIGIDSLAYSKSSKVAGDPQFTKKGMAIAERYIQFLNAIKTLNNSSDASETLWNHWVQLSAAKAMFQGEGRHIKLKTVDGRMIAMPTYMEKEDGGFKNTLKSAKDQGHGPFGGGVLSKDHLDLPDRASKVGDVSRFIKR